jgi:hypothetical protein
LQLGDVRLAALNLLVAVVGFLVEPDMLLVIEMGLLAGAFVIENILAELGWGIGPDRTRARARWVAVFSASDVRHVESSKRAGLRSGLCCSSLAKMHDMLGALRDLPAAG